LSKLILLRHGQSAWNKLNVFTGWIDVPLSKKGIEESVSAGKKIAEEEIDFIYTSSLVRAQTTVFLAMAEHKGLKVPCVLHEREANSSNRYDIGIEEKDIIPVYIAEELNERMYGNLQGKNKDRIALEYGSEQVRLWRRSFHTAPPGGESLAQTAERSIPFFTGEILPKLKAGKNVFVCAHGNSLRSIVMHLENLSETEVLELEIATGEIKTYNYENGRFSRL